MHRLRWDDLQFVHAVVEHGSLSAAARTLGVNHATVSRRLTQIERGFDAPVFDKVKGGYKASELGMEIVAAAEDMELIALAAERKSRAVSANLSGPIRVSMGEPIRIFTARDLDFSSVEN